MSYRIWGEQEEGEGSSHSLNPQIGTHFTHVEILPVIHGTSVLRNTPQTREWGTKVGQINLENAIEQIPSEIFIVSTPVGTSV